MFKGSHFSMNRDIMGAQEDDDRERTNMVRETDLTEEGERT